MSSHDLLEILASGAAFGEKSRKSGKEKARNSKSERPEVKGQDSSFNFFAPVVKAGTKRTRESTESVQPASSPIHKPAAEVDQDGNVAESQSHSGRASSKSNNNAGSSLALFKGGGGRDSSEKPVDTASPSVNSASDSKAKSVRQEEIACFRRQMGIRVRGEEIVDPMESFLDMPQIGHGQDAALTRRNLLRNVEESEWKEPTPVQMQAVPILVAGRDLLAAAPTGSGKTAAFVMPIILRLGEQCAGSNAIRGVRVILLAPTRELAAQIHRDIIRLSQGRKMRTCLLTKAGVAKAAAANGLTGYDIIVSTPMRLVTLLREETISLATVEMIVLDEADKLFDAGASRSRSDNSFVEQVDEVLAACSHRGVQRALFSATIGPKVRKTTKIHAHASFVIR